MLGSPPAQARELVAELQRVVGPVQELADFWNRGGWPLKASYLGHDLLIRVHTDRGVLGGLSFGAWLGGRPLLLAIHDRRTSLFGMRPFAVGPELDGHFRVFGWPEEVLREVLDPATRQWLVQSYAGRDPDLRSEDGYLQLYVPLRNMAGPFALPSGRVPSAEELAERLRVALALADRLTAAFDHAYASVAAAEGPDAAARWLQAQVDAGAARAEGGKKARRIVLASVLAIVLLPLVVAIVSMASCLHHTITIGR